MLIKIVPINQKNIKDAIDLAVSAEVGERDDVVKDMEKSLEEKIDRYFLAVVNNEVIGVSGWYQDFERAAYGALGDDFPEGDDIYWIAYFAVKPEYRGKGVGRLLMHRIEIELKAKCRDLWVYTIRARKFYEKCGFKFMKKGFIEDCWQDFLRKEL